jgi:hypothetical protein
MLMQFLSLPYMAGFIRDKICDEKKLSLSTKYVHTRYFMDYQKG